MIGWIVRIVMSLAGVITGWFVAEESTNFSIIQMVAAILLIIFFLAVATFWPSIVTWVSRLRRSEN